MRVRTLRWFVLIIGRNELRLFPLNDAVHEASALLLRLIFRRNGASAVKHLDAVGELADHPHVVPPMRSGFAAR